MVQFLKPFEHAGIFKELGIFGLSKQIAHGGIQKPRNLHRVDIKGQEFKHLSMSDWVNDKWVQSDFKFDESYVYRKMK